jgi:2'-hydroxyisoflavone reductase
MKILLLGGTLFLGRHLAEAAEAVGHNTFISTISVYAGFSEIGMTEEAPLGTLEDETVETIDGSTYGPLKALCERAVRDRLPDRSLIIRPGLIVGPHDPTDRFTYWVWRIARGGRVLAPPDPDFHVQIVDGRDLAAWTLSMIEHGHTGTYNATGPERPLHFREILERSRAVSGSDAGWVCPPAAFLQENDVQPFSDLPLWVDGPEYAGFFRADISRALAAGLQFRPLDETIAATLAWAMTRPVDHKWRSGLPIEREAELLESLGEKGNAIER